MKEDKWKHFIDDHKSEFDTDAPSNDLWNKIDQGLEGKQKKSNNWIWMAAASIVLILTVALFNRQLFNQKNDSFNITSIPDTIQNVTVSLDKDNQEVEAYYANEINEKIIELKKYPEAQELLEEVEELKSEYDILKEEMGAGLDKSIILEAMIENYRLRLLILDDLLEAVKKPQS